jgi:hypothetical protein
MRNIREHIEFMTPPEMTLGEKLAALREERAALATMPPEEKVFVSSSDKETATAAERIDQIDAGLRRLGGA